jgi:hypothetical protein
MKLARVAYYSKPRPSLLGAPLQTPVAQVAQVAQVRTSAIQQAHYHYGVLVYLNMPTTYPSTKAKAVGWVWGWVWGLDLRQRGCVGDRSVWSEVWTERAKTAFHYIVPALPHDHQQRAARLRVLCAFPSSLPGKKYLNHAKVLSQVLRCVSRYTQCSSAPAHAQFLWPPRQDSGARDGVK